MPSEYDALLDAQPAQQKSEYDALLEQPKQEGGVLSGIAAGIGRALNPINLIKGALDIGGESDISKISRYSHSLADIVSGKPVQESLEKNIPEVAQQRAALTGQLGGREQAAEITGLGLQAGLLALPFAHGKLATLRETAFGKTEAPLASETSAVEQIQKGGPSATEPNRETGPIPAEQGKPTQKETAVQPETRDTRETSSEAPAQEIGAVARPASEKEYYHGTREKLEGALKPGVGNNQKRFLHEEGIWFAPNKGKDFETSTVSEARRYSGDEGTIVSAHLELKNPYRGDVDELVSDKINAKWLKDHGYDGFIDDKSGSGLVAVLDPSQIKEVGREKLTSEVGDKVEAALKRRLGEAGSKPKPTETTTAQPLTQEKGGEVGEKVQVKGKDEGEGEKGVLTPEAAKVQPPAAPPTVHPTADTASTEPKDTGIGNIYLEDVYGDSAPVSTTGKGPKEWKNIGLGRLDNFQKTGSINDDPYTVLTNLRTGKVPVSQVPSDVSLLRAEHQRLVEDARKSEGTPEYEAKSQAALDMATAIKSVAHGPASDVFRALQEHDQPRYDNLTDFDQSLRERAGRESTPEEKEQFKRMADEVKQTRSTADKEVDVAQRKVQQYRSRDKLSFDDATKSIHDQITELTKDCVL